MNFSTVWTVVFTIVNWANIDVYFSGGGSIIHFLPSKIQCQYFNQRLAFMTAYIKCKFSEARRNLISREQYLLTVITTQSDNVTLSWLHYFIKFTRMVIRDGRKSSLGNFPIGVVLAVPSNFMLFTHTYMFYLLAQDLIPLTLHNRSFYNFSILLFYFLMCLCYFPVHTTNTLNFNNQKSSPAPSLLLSLYFVIIYFCLTYNLLNVCYGNIPLPTGSVDL